METSTRTTAPGAHAVPAAAANNLWKTYGVGDAAVNALAGVSVEFPAGQFAAIMGPSGSGKSTLMQTLAGLDSVSRGQAWIDGVEITGMKDAELTQLRRDRVGFIFQSFNLIPTLTASQNITLPSDLAKRPVDQAWMDHIVSTLGIADRLRHRPSELSGGQQQRVAVARALLTRPAVIFADEPTGNLDSHSTDEVLALLRTSVDELEQTVIMVTHDAAAAAHTDRVVLLTDGSITGELQSPTIETVQEAMRTATASVAKR
ncbi:ABC transporter ATP-binding protein [Humidisolicoccus flavus]|uniref:ABC transporter ATP-binding protein n=1 Tax=Humidisolicoccus flavus TaxID=3111414 RepID=UPI0032513182